MNLNKVIKLASEIKELRDKADRLESQLRDEMVATKSIFPTDFTKKKESHEEKFSTLPPGSIIPVNPSGPDNYHYWVGDSWKFWQPR